MDTEKNMGIPSGKQRQGKVKPLIKYKLEKNSDTST